MAICMDNRKERAKSVYEAALPYLLILPAIGLITFFKLVPIFSTLIDSVVVNQHATLNVYRRLFDSTQFWQSVRVTVQLIIIIVPVQIVIAYFLAELVRNQIRGIEFFRTVLYFPVVVSMTVATILWSQMLAPGQGIVNSILVSIGMEPQGFFIDKEQALGSIITVSTWRGVGYWMIFLLAGMMNIDSSIYESAEMDGARPLTVMIRITIPMLRRVMLFVVVANTIANLLLFVPVQLITKGGPQFSTNVLMYEAYKSAFLFLDRSRSAAIVAILLILIGTVVTAQFALLSSKDRTVVR